MAERRSSARQKSFLHGRVFYSNRRRSADCLVRDISEEGARLVFADVITIPDTVELYLSSKDAIERVDVQWRREKEIGIAFRGKNRAAGDAAASLDLFARIEKLEAEYAALKRTVNELRAELRNARNEAA
jgi:hypothetical protein